VAYGELVHALAGMPDVVARLLEDPSADAAGRCCACGRPGTGSPYLLAPCSVRGLAERAAAERRRRPEQ